MAAVDPVTENTKAIFPRLPAGRGAMSPEKVARHQKARLQGAMVLTVARNGYADTTLRELVGLAGVSKTTFYDHFENKQDCFLSTFDEIVAEVGKRVGDAYRQPGDFRQKLVAALAIFMQTAVEEPQAAALAAVESLSLGRAGVEHRERAAASFEALIQQSFDHSASGQPVSAVTVRAIVAGIRGIAYRRLRTGRQGQLPELVEVLVDWALGYQEPEGEAEQRARAAASEPPPPRREDPMPGWDEPPDSQLSRRSLSQRERIVRGAARVAVERGYDSLSIPAISAAAGTSNQTFYDHFSSKRDAFIAAFELLTADALATTLEAMKDVEDRPRAVGLAVRAILEHIAANELFAQLAFFELPAAGQEAMDRADAVLDGFTALLEPGLEEDVAGDDTAPTVIREAVGSGIWAVIQHEIAHGRLADLPAMAPMIVALATTRWTS